MQTKTKLWHWLFDVYNQPTNIWYVIHQIYVWKFHLEDDRISLFAYWSAICVAMVDTNLNVPICAYWWKLSFLQKVCLTYFEKSEKTSGVQRELLHVGIPPISPQLIHLSFFTKFMVDPFRNFRENMERMVASCDTNNVAIFDSHFLFTKVMFSLFWNFWENVARLVAS